MINPALRRWSLAPALLLGALLASTSLAQNTERPPRRPAGQRPPIQRPPMTRTPARPSISEPSDPAKVKGTYELNGKIVEVTEGEFFACYTMIKPHVARRNVPLRPQQVIEHILLFAEADALGFTPTNEELAELNPLNQGSPQYAQQLKERWKAMGISEQGYLNYLRQSEAINRMKAVLGNSVRVKSSEAYDLWKRDSQMFRIAYLQFAASDHEAQVQSETPDQLTLKKFWNSNTQVQNRFRLPTTVSGTILVFDPSKITDADIQRAQKARAKPISYEEAIAYFHANQERLMSQIPSAQRPRLYPKAPPKLESLITPFSLLRTQVEREILLGDRIGDAYREAASLKESWDPKSLAAKYGLDVIEVKAMGRTEMTDKLSHLGYELFSSMFASEPMVVPTAIHHHDGLQFFWKVTSRKISTLPSFDDAMKRGLVKEWKQAEAYARAKAQADEVMAALGKKAEAQIKAKSAEIDAKWNKQLAAALETAEGPQQRESIKTRFRARSQAEQNQLRHQSRAKYFDSVVAELGYTLKNHGPFVFSLKNRDRSAIEGLDAKRMAYLETNYAVKTLQPDQVTGILSDMVTKTHFIVKLIGREDPPFEKMSAVDFHRRCTQLERQRAHANTYDWTYMRANMRRKWTQF